MGWFLVDRLAKSWGFHQRRWFHPCVVPGWAPGIGKAAGVMAASGPRDADLSEIGRRFLDHARWVPHERTTEDVGGRTLTLLQCLVCGDLVSLRDDAGEPCRCVCGRAFAVMNDGVLELGGTGRAVWLDRSGALWDPTAPDAPPNGAPHIGRRVVPPLL